MPRKRHDKPLMLTEDERRTLEQWARRPKSAQRLALRARIVLACANVCVTPATGTAERDAAHLLLDASAPPGSTAGGDKNFDVAAFVVAVRALAITPHVAQKAVGTAIDGRTTRHAGYAISQVKRKLIEQVFGCG